MLETSEQASYTQATVLAPVKADALGPDERFCCICLQPFGSAASNQGGSEATIQLPCGHVFGEVCMASWARVNNSCPLCRRQVSSFGIGDRSAGQYSPASGGSILLSSVFSPQDDIWLDEYVWNNSSDSHQDAMSYIDFETLICHHPYNHSDVDLGSEYQRPLETLSCGEHRGFCQCSDDQNTRNAALLDRRLTTPTHASKERPNIDNFNLVHLGSQFSELDYQSKVWMDDFFDEPAFGENAMP